MTRFPEYTARKIKGNIGEAHVQLLLSNFCLVHKIDGTNDIGNDFICELLKENYPANLLFYIQVKHHTRRPDINNHTKMYWAGSPIPVFLFWVKSTPESPTSGLKLQYKRMTPVVHQPNKHRHEKFIKWDELKFKRDLIVDYARTQFQQGFAPIIEPRDFLTIDDKIALRLPKYQLLIDDVIPKEYSKRFLKRSWVNPFVTATLLSNNANDQGALNIAAELIHASLKLFEQSEDKEKPEFANMIRKRAALIDSKLTQGDL